MRRAEVISLGNLTSYRYGEESYDSTKLGLGKLMIQKSGLTNEENWAGPIPHTILRHFDVNGAVAASFPYATEWSSSASSKIDWVFFADTSTAAPTRRIFLATFNRLTAIWSYVGQITLTFPTATNHLVRGLRMDYETVTNGTVSTSGTAVTGVSTTFSASKVCVGNRIGFGSTNPSEISTWYEISAVGSDTSITLTSSAGTITAGTAYVIEDLRAIVTTTNATLTNGGLFIAKGLRFENFSLSTVVPAATTVDRIRAVYWLKDAATITNTVAAGVALEPAVSRTQQYCWVPNGTTTLQLFKHNIRADLTLTSGAATNQFLFSTAVSATLSGTMTQSNNGRIATLNHGPGNGITSYYFTTSLRVYRTKALSSIVASDSTFISGGDNMLPVHPGGNLSGPASAAPAVLTFVEHVGSLDKLLVWNNSGTPGIVDRAFLTTYKTDASPMDRGFSRCGQPGVGSSANSGVYPLGYSMLLGAWVETGMIYFINASQVNNSGLFAAPIGADWEYASLTDSRLVLPKMQLTDADKLTGVFAQEAQLVGGQNQTTYNLGSTTEPYRLYYRTTGIDDDTGSWQLIDQSGKLNIDGVSTIQLMAEFRTMGETVAHCSRLMQVAVLYEDTSTDSRYAFDGTKSNASSKQFAFWHAVAFGSAVPALRIRIFDADTNSLLVDDNTAAPTGTWERTTDGTSWSAWTNADRSNNTTWIRYTPASIADNVKARVRLSLN